MIVVHHLNHSRSQRVLWLLEELGLPYELKRYEREKSGLAPKSLEAVHPLGKSPVITDGDATLAESGAILEYLVETYAKDRLSPPAGTQAYRDYRYFLHYAEGSLMPFLVMRLVFNKVKSTDFHQSATGRCLSTRSGSGGVHSKPRVGSVASALASAVAGSRPSSSDNT